MSYHDQPTSPPAPAEEKKDNTVAVVGGTLGVLAALGGLAAALVGGSDRPSPRGRFQGRRPGTAAKRCNTPCGR